MSEFKKINGTPWHVGTIKKAEYDDRRHRSRCAFYNSENKRCTKYVGSCRGSAHCPSYKEYLLSGTSGYHAINQTNDNPNITIYECRIGAEVIHKSFGKGKIKKYKHGKIFVEFNGKTIKFKFPDVFKKRQMKYASDV